MFWSKKKIDKNIKDPVTRFGEMIRHNRAGKSKKSTVTGDGKKTIPHGCDRGFVYYEE